MQESRLILLVVLLTACAGMRLRPTHYERPVTATPEEALDKLTEMYHKYIKKGDKNVNETLSAALKPKGGDGENFTREQFDSLILDNGFKISRRGFAIEAWCSTRKLLYDTGVIVCLKRMSNKDKKERQKLRAAIETATWNYVVDSYYYKFDVDADELLDFDEVAKAKEELKSSWPDYSDAIDQQFKLKKGNFMNLDWWRHYFSKVVPSSKGFIRE